MSREAIALLTQASIQLQFRDYWAAKASLAQCYGLLVKGHPKRQWVAKALAAVNCRLAGRKVVA